MNPIVEQMHRAEPRMPERPLDPPDDPPSFWDQKDADERVNALAAKWLSGEVTDIPTSRGELTRAQLIEYAEEQIGEAAERINWEAVN